MCWNASVSLNTYLFSFFASILAYMNGMIVDWVRNGLNEGFEFKNPNERDRCGCGESFRI